MKTVAILYCDRFGTYSTMPGLDLWHEDRDARLYDKDYPIVGHPPCNRWSLMAISNKNKPGKGIGEDGGTFQSCLTNLFRVGGVIEHPAHTRAWLAFYLQKPQLKNVWEYSLDGYWICSVNQSIFKHECTKPTWLLYYSPTGRMPIALDHNLDMSRTGKRLEYLPSGSYRRIITPAEFAEYLVALASHAVS